MLRPHSSSLVLVASAAVLLFSAVSRAEPPRTLDHQKASPIESPKGSAAYGDEGGCGQCGGDCGRQGCGKHGCGQCCCLGGFCSKGNRAANQAASFNCGCNGSYKFPVPPLSTYHWPGMYSRQLMTDYQSPWRFPPLRPYTEEPPYNGGTGRQVSHVELPEVSYEILDSGVEPLSAKMKRVYGTK